MLIRTSLTCTLLLAMLPFALGQNEIAPPLHIDLSKTYGYCMAQKLKLDQIRQQFPSLALQATQAQMEFDLVFKRSYENIENVLKRMLPDKWHGYKSQTQKMLTDTFEASPFSEKDAMAFVKEASLRAKGEISSPVLETLLTYHPDFQMNPAEEFTRGFTQTFRTGGHAKAKGIDFQIQYPRSWRAKEGKRPNVIQIITSENGRGLESIVLMVKEVPLPKGYKLTQADINDLFTPQSLRETLPDGSTFVSAKSVVMDGHKGGMVVFDQVGQRLDVTVRSRNLQYVTFYNNKLIFIQCGAGEATDKLAVLGAKLKGLETLFKLVGNSFVLQSQYR